MKAALLAIGAALVVVLIGAGAFLRVSEPLIRRLAERAVALSLSNERLMTEIGERKRAKANLRESEERYASMFKNNQSVMLMLIPNTLEIEDANPAACSYYGYSKDVLTQKSIPDISSNVGDQELRSAGRGKNRRAFESEHVFEKRSPRAPESGRQEQVTERVLEKRSGSHPTSLLCN